MVLMKQYFLLIVTLMLGGGDGKLLTQMYSQHCNLNNTSALQDSIYIDITSAIAFLISVIGNEKDWVESIFYFL